MDWGLISTILAVIFFFVMIILMLKRTKKKKPSWAYKTEKIIGLGTNVPPELKLTFGGRPVNDVYRTTLILFNRGTEAIRQNDVVTPISMRFTDVEILREPVVVAKSNEAIQFSVKHITKRNENILEFNFLYLDHNDGGVVELIHTEVEQIIPPEAPIVGAKKISYMGKFRSSYPRPISGYAILFAVIAIGTAIANYLVGEDELLYTLPAIMMGLAIWDITNNVIRRKFPRWCRNIEKKKAFIEQSIEFYCAKCKTKRIVDNPRPIELKNGALAVISYCSECGTKMLRMLPR